MQRLFCHVLTASLVIGCGLPWAAAGDQRSSSETLEPSGPPGVVLVLSGGGARGAAHIGVLEVMEELQVPVDMVIGTSMGSVVGGLYAAGWTPEQLEGVITTVDWIGVFSDAVPHRDKSFRRKQDDADFLVRGSIRFADGRPYLPLGALQGRRIELLLGSLELQTARIRDFDRLPIPFRAVAADLGTSEAVVLDHGDLATAIRASMSIPGAFAPVKMDGRLLVDGGVAANLPVRVARELGAQRIIAIDISSPLRPDAEAHSLFSVMRRMTAFLTSGNVAVDRAAIGPQDLLITPPLGEFSFADFPHMKQAIEIGRQAARARAADLERFAVDDATWRAWRATHRRVTSRNLRIDRLEIHNASAVDDDILRARLAHHVGTSLDVARLDRDIMDLHGLELFGRVGADVVEMDDERVLVVDVGPPPYGRHSVRLGLGLKDDFETSSEYTLTVRHRELPVNRRGGEWLNVLQIGETQALRSELYQPLGDRLAWFVSPAAEYRRENWNLWVDGKPVTQLWLRSVGGGLDLGRTLSNWGEIRVGGYWYDRQVQERVGFPGLFEFEGIDAGARAQLSIRTLDSPVFPQSGTKLVLEAGRSLTAFGSDVGFTEYRLAVDQAWTFGRVTLVPGLEGYRSTGDNETLFAVAPLGGQWRLSGYGDRELLGQRLVLGRVVSYGELFGADLAGIRTRVYAGLSVEAGNAWFVEDDHDLGDLIVSGSVFLAADTILGPMYFGYGLADGGRDRWYLNIGASF